MPSLRQPFPLPFLLAQLFLLVIKQQLTVVILLQEMQIIAHSLILIGLITLIRPIPTVNLNLTVILLPTLPKTSLAYSSFSKAKTQDTSFGSAGFNELGVGMSATETIYNNPTMLAVDPYNDETGN